MTTRLLGISLLTGADTLAAAGMQTYLFVCDPETTYTVRAGPEEAWLFRPDGTLLPAAEWPTGSGGLIASLEIRNVRSRQRDRRLIGRRVSIRLLDRIRALELLGRHLGLFKAAPTNLARSHERERRMEEGRRRVSR